MRVIITGDRNWKCVDLAANVLTRLRGKHGDDITIVHGAAEGVDLSFDFAAKQEGFKVEPFAADWTRLGKGAGPERNRRMLTAGGDMVIACHRFIAKSRGTRDCCIQALKAGIPVYLIDNDEGVPERLHADDKRLD